MQELHKQSVRADLLCSRMCQGKERASGEEISPCRDRFIASVGPNTDAMKRSLQIAEGYTHLFNFFVCVIVNQSNAHQPSLCLQAEPLDH